MKNLISSLFLIMAIITISSCVVVDESLENISDYQTDSKNFFLENKIVTDGDTIETEEKKWQVEYSFFGIINDAESPLSAMQYGDGSLKYITYDGQVQEFKQIVWAIKKSTSNSSGHSIPLIQIFFINSIEDGEREAFILQLAGSSVPKDETWYLNYDKIYRATLTFNNNKITHVCYDEQPDDGRVFLFSDSIRTGEIISLQGHAEMETMDPRECHSIDN